MRSLVLLAWLLSPAFGQTVSTAPATPALKLLADSELPDLTDTFESRAGLIRAAKKSRAYLERAVANPSTPRYFKLGERDYSTGILIESIDELLSILKSSPSAAELAEQVKARFDVFQSVG